MERFNLPEKLTSRAYWDAQYAPTTVGTQPSGGGLVGALRRRFSRWDHGYDEYFLWEVLYERYLPRGAGLRAVEIGSAPGTHMVKMAKRFGVEPWGIEYTPSGAELNRRVFAEAGFSQATVIEEDFAAPAVLEKYSRYFDVVVSRGFIEHFDEPQAVVARHVELLQPGGTLVVSIPNVAGVNRLLQQLIDGDVIGLHNLTIMERSRFRKLFDGLQLEEQFCGYFGTFSLGFVNAGTRPGRRPLVLAAHLVQRGFDILERGLIGRRSVNHRTTSPYLIYIGRKAARP